MQKIKLTDGCPNGCAYCYEPKVKPQVYALANFIPLSKEVQILDMNFLSNPRAWNILLALPKRKYEMVCGFDFRRLNPKICSLLKEKGFHTIRWAWDYGFNQQKVHNKVWKMFRKAGFRSEDLSVFILSNWKIPYDECCSKLDLLKVWNVKVCDCCFDGGYKTPAAGFWKDDQIKNFRRKCRKHNQMVLFKIDPELK